MSKIAIIEVFPSNFTIKSQGDKEAIIETFRKFVNALEFPIQILIDTNTLDADSYLTSLGKRIKKEEPYPTLFDNFNEFLTKTISKNSIRNRNFYVVIPESMNIDIQIEVIEDKLNNLKLSYHRVGTEQLKGILTKFFSGSGTGTIAESLQPEKIIIAKDHIVNGTFSRVVCASGYPRTVEAGFLDRIISASGNFDISLHIEPYPIDTMLVNLNRELQKQRADLYALSQRGMLNPSLEIQYADTKSVLEELQKGNDKLFNVSLYIHCKATSKEDLDTLTKKVESELNSLMIIPKVPRFRMAQALQSCAPLARDVLKMKRNIPGSSLAAFYPFTSSFFRVDDTGVWFGLNKNNIPIIRDIFKLSNPNGIILAQSGGGKSYFAKLIIARYLLNCCKVMIIDPQGEYSDLVKHFNGQHIKLSRTSPTMINPLDLIGHDYAEKRLSLMDLTKIMFGELTEPQKSFVDKAITEVYKSKGINEKPETWGNEPPILEDILHALERMEKKAIIMEKKTIRSLINRLSMYVNGVFSFLNRQTSINFGHQFVCFDVAEMPSQVKPLMMFLVLDYVYSKMKKDITRKLLVIDEAWSLLSRTEDAGYILEIVKTCRKFNMGLLLINQEVDGLLDSKAGKSVLANSAYTFLMRQKPAVIDGVQETFHLSSTERSFLLTAPVGQGILLMEDDHTELKVIASEEEHRLITTNADERLANKEDETMKTSFFDWLNMEAFLGVAPETNKLEESHVQEEIIPVLEQEAELETEQEKPTHLPLQILEAPPAPSFQKVVNINVWDEQRCYRKADLTPEEIDYRLKHGYHETEQWDIETNKSDTFLIITRKHESDSHMFLLWRIAEYLKKFTDTVETFETNQPDITFEAEDGRRIAVEVETGTLLEKAPKQLMEKVKRLNKDFDDWFFVITHSDSYWDYKKLGKTFTRKNVLVQLREYFPSHSTPKNAIIEPEKPQFEHFEGSGKSMKKLFSEPISEEVQPMSKENTEVVKMENNEEVKQQKRAPIVESLVSRSQDGKWIIHKTVITDIKAVAYYEQVMKNN